MMSEKQNKRYAILGTILFAVVLLFILLFVSMRSVIPPKHDKAVELDFLAQEGLFEPVPARLVFGVEGVLTAAPAAAVPAALPSHTETTVGENLITQNNGETVALAQKRQQQTEDAARIAGAVASAFTSPTDTGGGQGSATVQGGSPQGSPDGSATGVLGGSSALKGRFGGSQIPNEKYNESGKVAVDIIVDASGKVTEATVSLSGTNTNSPTLRRIAREAALKAHFSAQQGAKLETGTITYIFNLN